MEIVIQDARDYVPEVNDFFLVVETLSTTGQNLQDRVFVSIGPERNGVTPVFRLDGLSQYVDQLELAKHRYLKLNPVRITFEDCVKGAS